MGVTRRLSSIPTPPSVKDPLLAQKTVDALYDSIKNKQLTDDELDALFDEALEKSRNPRLAQRTEFPEMCSFVSGAGSATSRNHDLQMASLIGGQSYLGTSGVAPGTHVILTRAALEHGRLDLLMDLIARRPEVRVVNFSQGPGRLRGEKALRSSPYVVYYHKLNRLIMELSIAGMLATRETSATRFLVVAAAGNVPAFEPDFFEPQEVLDRRIPSQAIYYGHSIPRYIDLRAHYLRDVPHPDLPLVIVGALGPTGMLPSYGRIDQAIDLYAPAGLDWLGHVRVPPSPAGARRLDSAEWRQCVCARPCPRSFEFRTAPQRQTSAPIQSAALLALAARATPRLVPTRCSGA